jgi:prevent-host-death family protein
MSVREARDQLGRLIDAAHYAGEITIITRQGEPWAAIVPLEAIKAERDGGPSPDTHATGT